MTENLTVSTESLATAYQNGLKEGGGDLRHALIQVATLCGVKVGEVYDSWWARRSGWWLARYRDHLVIVWFDGKSARNGLTADATPLQTEHYQPVRFMGDSRSAYDVLALEPNYDAAEDCELCGQSHHGLCDYHRGRIDGFDQFGELIAECVVDPELFAAAAAARSRRGDNR